MVSGSPIPIPQCRDGLLHRLHELLQTLYQDYYPGVAGGHELAVHHEAGGTVLSLFYSALIPNASNNSAI